MTDERLERMIAALLRAGVILSAAVVLLGGLCYLVRHGTEPADYRTFHGAPAQYRTLSGLVAQRDCRAVIQLGLLILLATPIARVAFSLVAFGLERDWTYVVITTIVLIILIYSLSLQISP